MDVHAGPIVAEERLGHERRREPEIVADVLHDVLVRQKTIGRLYQGAELEINFRLSCRRDFMMLHLDGNACFDQGQHDLRPNVLQPVDWRYREVPLLMAGTVPQVRYAIAA